jgi:hypothetical protein
MTPKEKELIIAELLKSDKIRGIYDAYIVKNITFEQWVNRMVGHILNPKEYDASIILKEIVEGDKCLKL